MALNGVSGKWFSEKMNTGYHPDPKLKDSAKEGFSKNLKGMTDQKPEKYKRLPIKKVLAKSAIITGKQQQSS